MFKKIIFVALVLLMASCGSHKKSAYKKGKPSRDTTVNRYPSEESKKNGNETLESTSITTVTTNTVEEYIAYYSTIAKSNMERYGIPASITMAQAILESGAGKGELVQKANNHFGIKCHTGWTGEVAYHDDDARGECFRKYPDPRMSFEDHSKFLTTRSRYAALFKLKKDDYKGWARGLREAGYATDKRYPEKLIGLIERYGLDQYDREVLKGKFIPDTEVVHLSNEQKHTVQKGDTLYSISKKYNTTVDELKKINRLNDNTISIGQELIIKK